jgi:hypothetical protein
MGGILRFLRNLNPSAKPELDPATVGISFVDILFALAAGVALAPLQSWASDTAKNHLPPSEIANVVVALALILGSFIGYHNSTNRPRFKIRFVNVSFIKFTLDISMVVVYFLVAGFASASPSSVRYEALLITVVFGLYLLWDFAGWYEASDPRYENSWKDAFADKNRPDVTKPWKPMDRSRAIPTAAGLVLSAGLFWHTLTVSVPPSRDSVLVVDALFVVILFGYRLSKDLMGRDKPKDEATSASQGIDVVPA